LSQKTLAISRIASFGAHESITLGAFYETLDIRKGNSLRNTGSIECLDDGGRTEAGFPSKLDEDEMIK